MSEPVRVTEQDQEAARGWLGRWTSSLHAGDPIHAVSRSMLLDLEQTIAAARQAAEDSFGPFYFRDMNRLLGMPDNGALDAQMEAVQSLISARQAAEQRAERLAEELAAWRVADDECRDPCDDGSCWDGLVEAARFARRANEALEREDAARGEQK